MNSFRYYYKKSVVSKINVCFVRFDEKWITICCYDVRLLQLFHQTASASRDDLVWVEIFFLRRDD